MADDDDGEIVTLIPLRDATDPTCGGKARALAQLLRSGLPVPDGFVVPTTAHDLAVGDLTEALGQLGDPVVAVRSSAPGEDASEASAAGMYESVLGVRGVDQVMDAIRTCRASLSSPRATSYRPSPTSGASAEPGAGGEALTMAVVVQRHLDAEVSGVLFTPSRVDEPTVIEAARGLGPSVAAGSVTPDRYHVSKDGTVDHRPGVLPTRLDRGGTGLVVRTVSVEQQGRPTLDDAAAARLAKLGEKAAAVFGTPQDVEWLLVDDEFWIVQSRPITAPLPDIPRSASPDPSSVRPRVASPEAWLGTPGSAGIVTGRARVVQGPDDFGRVRPGDVVICRYTDPAWTPLLRIVAGVVTETGGVLSHAAIVAREYGIPAVLGVAGVFSAIPDDAVATVDGSSGTVTVTTPSRST